MRYIDLFRFKAVNKKFDRKWLQINSQTRNLFKRQVRQTRFIELPDNFNA